MLELPGRPECAAPIEADASRAWLSSPSLGKHICFDGRWLHAAPVDLADLLGLGPPTAGGASAGVGAPAAGAPSGAAAPGVKATPGAAGEEKASAGGARDAAGAARKGAKVAALKGASVKAPEAAAAAAASAAEPSARSKRARDGASEAAGRRKQSKARNGKARSSAAQAARPKRVTFLVNVWVNHRPESAVPMAEAAAAALSQGRVALDCLSRVAVTVIPPPATATLLAGAAAAAPPDGSVAEASAAPAAGEAPPSLAAPAAATSAVAVAASCVRSWNFGEVGTEARRQVHEAHVVSMPMNAAAVRRGLAEGKDSFELRFEAPHLAIVRKKPAPPAQAAEAGKRRYGAGGR
ncbi:unnamed protein product [Phaeothamnion confervicola]